MNGTATHSCPVPSAIVGESNQRDSTHGFSLMRGRVRIGDPVGPNDLQALGAPDNVPFTPGAAGAGSAKYVAGRVARLVDNGGDGRFWTGLHFHVADHKSPDRNRRQILPHLVRDKRLWFLT